jgi:hypothetical protein
MHLNRLVLTLLSAALALLGAPVCSGQHTNAEAKIKQALRAAPAGVAQDATVKDWDGSVLRKGGDGWTCYPGPEHMPDSPMCFDPVWAEWAPAWAGKKPFKTDKIGIAYMLMGDNGGSNRDPYADGPTPDNDWVVEGPHLMILVPDAKMLDAVSTDPHNGGPYGMWKGTPYAHIMAPVR